MKQRSEILASASVVLVREKGAPGSVTLDELLALHNAISAAIAERNARAHYVDTYELSQLKNYEYDTARLWEQRLEIERRRQKAAPLVQRAPGARALDLLELIASKRTVDRVYAPTVADMREEHIEALAARKFGRARWICVRGHLSLVASTIKLLPLTFAKRLYEIWKAI